MLLNLSLTAKLRAGVRFFMLLLAYGGWKSNLSIKSNSATVYPFPTHQRCVFPKRSTARSCFLPMDQMWLTAKAELDLLRNLTGRICFFPSLQQKNILSFLKRWGEFLLAVWQRPGGIPVDATRRCLEMPVVPCLPSCWASAAFSGLHKYTLTREFGPVF